MKTPSPAPSASRRFVAALLLAHLLAVLALAASPRLHAWVHPGEVDDDDDCAAVLFLHGAVEGGATMPLLTVALVMLVAVFAAVPQSAAFVPSVFARGRVFEHAPPVAA